MRKFSQIAFIILLSILFFEVWLGFPRRLELVEESTSEANSEEFNKSVSDQKMTGVHLVESQSGNRDWELFAVKAEGSSGTGTWKLFEVKLQFYSNDNIEFIVTGGEGTINTTNKDITVSKGVTTKTINGYRYESERVHYSAKNRLITGQGPVRVLSTKDEKGAQLSLLADAMQAEMGKSSVELLGNVQAKRSAAGQGELIVTAEKAKLSSVNRTASFAGQVSMGVGDLKIEGPEAELNYQNGDDFLRSVFIKGGVRVSDLDKYATSESVQFDPEQNQFIFRGKPRVVQDEDEITGDEIVFIDGGKRVKVQKIRAKVDNKSKN